MKAIIMAGGLGTRLRPLTLGLPKPMVPMGNKPMMEHVVSLLKKHGFDHILSLLYFQPESIRDYFGDGTDLGIRMEYVQEGSPLGTAGAVKNAAAHLESTFVVLNGDIFTELDLSEMIALHRANGAEATIALTPVENPTAFGVVELDQIGRVRRFVEKPPPDQVTSNLINAGIYVLEPSVLEEIPSGIACMFERHTFPGLLQRDQILFKIGDKSLNAETFSNQIGIE